MTRRVVTDEGRWRRIIATGIIVMRAVMGIAVVRLSIFRTIVELAPRAAAILGIVAVELSIVIEGLFPAVARPVLIPRLIAGPRPTTAGAGALASTATATAKEAAAIETGAHEAAAESTSAAVMVATLAVRSLTTTPTRLGVAGRKRITRLRMRKTRLGLRLK